MKKILVVDDDLNICEMLRFILESQGYVVSTINDGKEALNSVKEDKPELVLLDIVLPSMNGIEVLRNIKEIDENIKVIMITAYSNYGEKIVEAFRLGACDCIFKPFNIEYLKESILEVIAPIKP
ncbi:MAG: response regulator [Elusimicrobia bacterium]|nr:response regulator [Elusimicrobiota bacterium]